MVEMPFVVWTRVRPRNHVCLLDGSRIPHVKGHFYERTHGRYAERYWQNAMRSVSTSLLYCGSLWAVAGGGGGSVRGRDSGGRVRQQHATPQPPGPPRVSRTTLAAPGPPCNHLDHHTIITTTLRPLGPPCNHPDHPGSPGPPSRPRTTP